MEVRDHRASDIAAIRELLMANEWAHRVGSVERLAQLLAASQRSAVAVKGGDIVGFARGITDGLSNGYLSMVVVDASYRRQGIGKALVNHIVGDTPGITWVLRAERQGAHEFFAKLGFRPSSSAMERPREKR